MESDLVKRRLNSVDIHCMLISFIDSQRRVGMVSPYLSQHLLSFYSSPYSDLEICNCLRMTRIIFNDLTLNFSSIVHNYSQ